MLPKYLRGHDWCPHQWKFKILNQDKQSVYEVLIGSRRVVKWSSAFEESLKVFESFEERFKDWKKCLRGTN